MRPESESERSSPPLLTSSVKDPFPASTPLENTTDGWLNKFCMRVRVATREHSQLAATATTTGRQETTIRPESVPFGLDDPFRQAISLLSSRGCFAYIPFSSWYTQAFDNGCVRVFGVAYCAIDLHFLSSLPSIFSPSLTSAPGMSRALWLYHPLLILTSISPRRC